MSTLADLPPLPALVVGSVHHTRHRPLTHSFTHRHYQWLVDLDDLPRLPRWLRPFAQFRGEDHLAGNPGIGALKANVRRVLERDDGVGARADSVTRIVMLAHARVLGHTFDPMTAFWCFDADGHLVAVLVEVHNTYGGRHAYVFTPDGVSIRLLVDGDPLVTATVSGTPRPASAPVVARTVARHPLMTQRVSGLIRVHGIWLWARRLRVRPRSEASLESVR